MRASSPHVFLFILFCLRRPASRRWTATRSRTLTSRKMLTAFFRFFCFASFYFVASQVFIFRLRRPASRRWTATRSRTLTARKMLTAFFRFFCFASFYFSPPAASVSPLDRDKVTDLDLKKNANRIFPFLLCGKDRKRGNERNPSFITNLQVLSAAFDTNE